MAAPSRVGFWYATGPADKDYKVGDPAFSIHTVIADQSEYPGCVLVENAARQRECAKLWAGHAERAS